LTTLKRYLHIVCLDVPFPADYGGAIDMFNRIKAFHKQGIGIHLHYFCYNDRGTPNELNQFCESISVYDRKSLKEGFSFSQPFIVGSRVNDKLINNLQQDQHPILIEGIHCTGILPFLDLSVRKVVVRVHNEESLYYKELARSSFNPLKKMYFSHESHLLKEYSKKLPHEPLYACITESDKAILQQKYELPNVRFIPAFPSWQEVTGEEGIGNLCLYHGNLSVPENEEAALWLLCRVFTKIRVPLVIAGKKPSKRLQKAAHLCQHTCLVSDPTETEMNDLVRKAHIHVLPSFNKNMTGIRLKLLHALFQGRHCVVNAPMVEGTGLEPACHIGSNANAFAAIIAQLYHQPFSEEEIRLRKSLLAHTYDNDQNAKSLIQWLW